MGSEWLVFVLALLAMKRTADSPDLVRDTKPLVPLLLAALVMGGLTYGVNNDNQLYDLAWMMYR